MLRSLAMGVLLGFAAFGAVVACSPSELPGLVRCQLDALRVLPEDPMQATAYDAVDLVQRLKECRRSEAAADGGP